MLIFTLSSVTSVLLSYNISWSRRSWPRVKTFCMGLLIIILGFHSKKIVGTPFYLHYFILLNSCSMVLKGLFEGDFAASICADKFLLMSIGGQVEHQACEGHHWHEWKLVLDKFVRCPCESTINICFNRDGLRIVTNLQ
jgi:hypothetical protein